MTTRKMIKNYEQCYFMYAYGHHYFYKHIKYGWLSMVHGSCQKNMQNCDDQNKQS